MDLLKNFLATLFHKKNINLKKVRPFPFVYDNITLYYISP